MGYGSRWRAVRRPLGPAAGRTAGEEEHVEEEVDAKRAKVQEVCDESPELELEKHEAEVEVQRKRRNEV